MSKRTLLTETNPTGNQSTSKARPGRGLLTENLPAGHVSQKDFDAKEDDKYIYDDEGRIVGTKTPKS